MMPMKLVIQDKFLDDNYLINDPVEKNIPGVYYGDLSEYTVKLQ